VHNNSSVWDVSIWRVVTEK